MIEGLSIENYKSISHLHLDCERINILIGEPNSGKSNILEALDLSYLSWMLGVNQDNKQAGIEQIDIKKFFRAKKTADLFYFGNVSNPIAITHPGFSYGTYLKFIKEEGSFEWRTSSGTTSFDNAFNPIDPIQSYGSPIQPYRYQSNAQFHDRGNYISTLMPPFGNNLNNVIRNNKDMQLLLKDFADQNNFEMALDRDTQDISIQLRINEGLVFGLPYEALADTFKRMLFYIAAVRHNNASVITLDEPDTHAFPRYVSYLADEIIKNQSSQFFIATHNPYLLNCLVENTPKGELAVFVCGYDKPNMTTTAKRLSDDDLGELLDYGVDIFFNLNRYLNDNIEYSA